MSVHHVAYGLLAPLVNVSNACRRRGSCGSLSGTPIFLSACAVTALFTASSSRMSCSACVRNACTSGVDRCFPVREYPCTFTSAANESMICLLRKGLPSAAAPPPPLSVSAGGSPSADTMRTRNMLRPSLRSATRASRCSAGQGVGARRGNGRVDPLQRRLHGGGDLQQVGARDPVFQAERQLALAHALERQAVHHAEDKLAELSQTPVLQVVRRHGVVLATLVLHKLEQRPEHVDQDGPLGSPLLRHARRHHAAHHILVQVGAAQLPQRPLLLEEPAVSPATRRRRRVRAPARPPLRLLRCPRAVQRLHLVRRHRPLHATRLLPRGACRRARRRLEEAGRRRRLVDAAAAGTACWRRLQHQAHDQVENVGLDAFACGRLLLERLRHRVDGLASHALAHARRVERLVRRCGGAAGLRRRVRVCDDDVVVRLHQVLQHAGVGRRRRLLQLLLRRRVRGQRRRLPHARLGGGLRGGDGGGSGRPLDGQLLKGETGASLGRNLLCPARRLLRCRLLAGRQLRRVREAPRVLQGGGTQRACQLRWVRQVCAHVDVAEVAAVGHAAARAGGVALRQRVRRRRGGVRRLRRVRRLRLRQVHLYLHGHRQRRHGGRRRCRGLRG
eukprot:Rhum_TRINITY_DN8465_c0_g1::Rhum_TRINITY_DN8465_c0_g1_i1::g.28041::m.28041